MPRSALPPHLNDPSEIEANFPDDSDNGRLWRWFKKTTKHWLVFGPRATEWWARWREYPFTILAVGSDGEAGWRVETDREDEASWDSYWNVDQIRWSQPHALRKISNDPTLFQFQFGYLSRVQYKLHWHVQLQWPLFFACHFGTWQFYIGFKRDADRVYWLSLFVGRTWK